MYCCSEICIAAPKYVLPLQKMYSHSKYGIQAAYTHSQTITDRPHIHYRPTNGHAMGSPSSYHALTVCRRPSAHGQSFEHAQNSCRAWIDGGVLWTCSTVRIRPTMCLTMFRRLHQLFHTVAYGETTRQSVAAALLMY